MHAIVIDDSRAIRALLGKFLRELGFEVSEAGDGKEALERLQENPGATVAMVDWNMPEMDGYDFICSVRANQAYDNLRLIMVTTETEMNQVAKALEAGADEYVMKPFTKEMIMEKLDMLGLTTTSTS